MNMKEHEHESANECEQVSMNWTCAHGETKTGPYPEDAENAIGREAER